MLISVTPKWASNHFNLMNKNLRIAILGCGNMGQAFAKAFLQYNLVARTDMLLLGRDDAHCTRLNATQLGMPTALLSALGATRR